MVSFSSHLAPKARGIVKAAALPLVIAATAMILIAILFTVVFPGFVIPNWLTMAVEIGVGIFITLFLFNLQAKTDGSIRQTIEKMNQYNEEQKKLQRSVTHASLERIERYLSMAWNGMGIDKDIMTRMEETQQLNFVEDLLRSKYSQSFKVLDVVDQLQRETGFVRQYIVPELQVLLKSVIEKIQILYGLLPYFPQVAGVVRVERWSSICDGTLSQIERTQKLIQENLAAD